MSQRKIFKKTLDWVQDRIDRGLLDSTSGDLLEDAVGTLRAELRTHFRKKYPENVIYNAVKKEYGSAYKDLQSDKNITTRTLKDLKPKLLKELNNRVTNSFMYIKNKDDEIIQKLASRFMSWVTIDSKEVRGNTTSKQSLLNFLDFAKENGMSETHAKMVLRDQISKMRAGIDLLVAEENNAIACVWKTRKDKRVVGNPAGLYPQGNTAHNDHWEREGKIYIFKEGWAKKRGYVKGEYYEDLEDGGVGKAIGCRCRLEMIYDLRDLPSDYLTKKGEALIESA